MLIKSLIKQLEQLYSTYDNEYKSMMGEPTIHIDVFSRVGDKYEYSGIGNDIKIEKSTDGVYSVLSAFGESYPKPKNSAWPFPTAHTVARPYPETSNTAWPFPKAKDFENED
jgi:hypothetical protein